jgi:hypothetical protein
MAKILSFLLKSYRATHPSSDFTFYIFPEIFYCRKKIRTLPSEKNQNGGIFQNARCGGVKKKASNILIKLLF